MLKRFFGKSKEKFAIELPDSPEQESNAVFAPPVAEQKETDESASAPVADENVNALTAEADESTPSTNTSSAPSATNYVDSREFIIAAVRESSAETKAEAEKASNGPSFAETFLTTTGNKSERRRPGLSMDPFMGLAKTIGSKV